MIPLRIANATHKLGAPNEWNTERNGRCTELYVRVTLNNVFESAWEPTPAEVAALVAGGRVILRIYGGQPPVRLVVTEAEFVEAPNEAL